MKIRKRETEEERKHVQEALRNLTNRRGTKNLFFTLFFFFFIGGYLFFFTSRYWMPTTGEEERFTQIGQVTEWDGKEIRLIRWDYAPEQQMMEVEIDLKDLSFQEPHEYEFSAMEINQGPLKVTTVLEETNWAVVQISAVPERWAEISFRISTPDNEEAGTLRMYTNIEDVHRVSRIETLDRQGYQVARLENEITIYEDEIEELQEQIQDEKDRISMIQDEISELKQGQEYETEEQVEESEALIEEAQTQIQTAEDAIEEAYEDIVERQERIGNLQEQIRELQGR